MSINPGNGAEADLIKNRRKSSTQVKALEKALENPIAAVEISELSDEDRKLAQLGYIQVRN